MSDEHLERVLGALKSDETGVDMAEFQSAVWARIDSDDTRSAVGATLGRALALRAVPAVVALVVGGVLGAGAMAHSEPDLLAVFDEDAGWSFSALVDEGEVR